MTSVHNILADCYNYQSTGKMHCALPSKGEISEAMAKYHEEKEAAENLTLENTALINALKEVEDCLGRDYWRDKPATYKRVKEALKLSKGGTKP